MTSFEFKFGKPGAPQGSRALARKKPTPSKPVELKASKDVAQGTGSLKFGNPGIPGRKKPAAPKAATGALVVLKASQSVAEGTGFIRRKAKKRKLKGEAPAPPSSKSHSLFSENYKNVHINTDVKGVSVAERVFSTGGDFGVLGLHRHLQSNLEKHGFTVLTTVQEKAIPVVLSGKNCLVNNSN